MEEYTKPYFPHAKVEPIFPTGIMTFKYENSLERKGPKRSRGL